MLRVSMSFNLAIHLPLRWIQALLYLLRWLCCINSSCRSSARCSVHQAATAKMSNSLFTNRTSSWTRGLHVRQCPRRIIRITSKPLIVAAAVLIV